MKLSDICKAIQAHNEHLTCKVQRKKNQILVQSNACEGETAVLLSPYYQQKLENDTFTIGDLEELKVEADRIYKSGH